MTAPLRLNATKVQPPIPVLVYSPEVRERHCHQAAKSMNDQWAMTDGDRLC
jgi:hypothetical protein